MDFAVLFVCTGNICRSPLGERILRSRLGPSAPIQVLSAGTHAVVGMGIDPPSALALRELGIDSEGHVARQLTSEEVDAADLILTAETIHRSAIVRADPLTFRKTFTMREFGRLGADLAPMGGQPSMEKLRARVAEVADQRGLVDAPAPGADQIRDPFGAPLDAARETAGSIAASIDAIVTAFGLTPSLR